MPSFLSVYLSYQHTSYFWVRYNAVYMFTYSEMLLAALKIRKWYKKGGNEGRKGKKEGGMKIDVRKKREKTGREEEGVR